MSFLTLNGQEETETTYQIVKSSCKTHGSEGAIVYGFEAIFTSESVKFDDVSPNEHDVEQLILRLKNCQVTSDQLIYIVEDYIIGL